MPLSINVGLSRKASKDFQSSGVSINVTAELDQSLLARPNDLQEQIGSLYAQAQKALDQQAEVVADRSERARQAAPPSNGREAGHNGNGNGHSNPMTASQHRAILAISRRVKVNPVLEAREIIGAELDNLTLRQASQLIDHLQDLQPAEGDGR